MIVRGYYSLLVMTIWLAFLTGCQESAIGCEEMIKTFEGHYEGPAIVIADGTMTIPLGPDCSPKVRGDYAFHRQAAGAWKEAEFGYRGFRAVSVDLRGQLAKYEREYDFLVLQLSKMGSVRAEVAETDAATVFEERLGTDLDGNALD